MMAAIESAEGVLKRTGDCQSVRATDRNCFRSRRLRHKYETKRYPDGQELSFARNMILHAARAAGIAAIDTVYSDVDNVEGFQNEVQQIKQLGFDGKSVINPRQIPLVNAIYTPTDKEIQNAKESYLGNSRGRSERLWSYFSQWENGRQANR